MAVYEQPALDQWKLREWSGGSESQAVFASRMQSIVWWVNIHASNLGTGNWDNPAARPIIGTGHQAWLWHPGILAKDIRSRRTAAGAATTPVVVHVVVDHDVHEALAIELPVIIGDRLSVTRVRLADEKLDVPSGCQAAVDGEAVARRVEALLVEYGTHLPTDVRAGLTQLAAAFRKVFRRGRMTLAAQVTAVTWEIARQRGHEWADDVGVMFGTKLCTQLGFNVMVAAFLADAERAVEQYNAATRLFPGAGIGELRMERERVELPLWWLLWDKPRQRVFADLSNRQAVLVLEDGTEIPWREEQGQPGNLAPRAILLTAVFRGWLCDGFVHGKGGGVYDQITEKWWELWGAKATGVQLAPMAVASADIRMQFDVPVASVADLTRAVWRERWLKHNVDVALGTPDEKKRALIEAMEHGGAATDRRARRRRNAERFNELKRINAALAEKNPELIASAARDVERARLGCANRATAMKRDWFWGLYSERELSELG